MLVEERVVLVDEYDQVLGTEEKIKAHELALLHRAFSVFIYRRSDSSIEFLLQQRHRDKYHCGGLWTNACCSHPRIDEEILSAGRRRLKEEMSIDLPLRKIGSFQYKAHFENGLTEHEFDHVLVGEYNSSQMITVNPAEVQAFRWISTESLLQELSSSTKHFTPWFKQALNLVLEDLCFNS